MKKILFVIHELSKGGAQTVLLNLISALPENYTCSILYFDEPTTMKQTFEDIGVKTYYFCNRNLKTKFFRLKKLLKEINPDIIHTHLPPGLILFYLYLRLMGYKKVFITYHTIVNAEKLPLTRTILEFFTQFLITKYLHVSLFSSNYYRKKFHIIKKKSNIIHNGINLPTADSSKPTPNNTFKIISIANLHPYKGYQFAIPAVLNLMDKYPQIEYHILGAVIQANDEQENFINELYSKINTSPHQSKIVFHGGVDTVFKHLCSSQLFLCPSLTELLPMSIIEAMACKVPVIATDVGGIAELLGINNDWGILVQPNSSNDIYIEIEDFIKNNNKLEEYSKKAYIRSRQFSNIKMAEQYVKEFNLE